MLRPGCAVGGWEDPSLGTELERVGTPVNGMRVDGVGVEDDACAGGDGDAFVGDEEIARGIASGFDDAR